MSHWSVTKTIGNRRANGVLDTDDKECNSDIPQEGGMMEVPPQEGGCRYKL